MNEYDFIYTKTRRQFGRPCNFSRSACLVLNEVSANSEIASEYICLNPQESVVDTIPVLSMHSVNTDSVVTRSHGQYHVEGGWPKEIDPTDPQDTSKWRKRLDKDPQFVGAVSTLCTDMRKIIDQNNSIDMYEEYFAGDIATLDSESLECSTIGLFRDPLKRTVSRISWHPDGACKLLASYSLLKFQRMSTEFDPSLYIWDTLNPNSPVLALSPRSPLIVAHYYGRNPDLIAGGNALGRVEFFDLRLGSKPVAFSSYEASHSEPVFDISWLQSKTHSELVSTSPDGQVIWWDTRNLIQSLASYKCAAGGTCIEWQQEAGPTKYLVGTESGFGQCLTKKPGKPIESTMEYGRSGGRHCGPIYSIKRNPFHPKYFLTAGDSCVKLWLEELRNPLFETRRRMVARVASAAWSPNRAGLFMTGDFSGDLDFHDIAQGGVHTHRVSNIPISTIAPCAQFVAVGDTEGTVSIVRLCEELAVGSNAEKTLVGSIFEREQRRERNLDTLKKQLGAKNSPTGFVARQLNPEEYIQREMEWLEEMNLVGEELTVKT